MPKIIRASDRGQPARFNLDDMAVQASECVAKARAEAAQIIAAAAQGAESIRIQAEAEGRRAAEQAIDQVVEQRLDERLIPLKTALATALDDLQSARHEWLAHWEEQAVHLALSIAERVIRRELRADPEIPVELVREALQLAAGSARLRLLMHPTDVAALGGPLQKLLDELAPLDSIALVPDTAISRGGCRVETENGVVDQQFEAQLARIAEELA